MKRLHKGNYMGITHYLTRDGVKNVYNQLKTLPEVECEFMDVTHGLVGKNEDTIGVTLDGMKLLNQHNVLVKDEWLVLEDGYETTRENYSWEEDLV